MVESNAVSKRTTRVFLEEQDIVENGTGGRMTYESQYGSMFEDKEMTKKPESWSPARSIDLRASPAMDIGTDLCGIVPNKVEDFGKEGMHSPRYCHFVWVSL